VVGRVGPSPSSSSLIQQLGAIEAQWFPLPVRIGSPRPGRFHYLTVVGCHWGPVIPTSSQNWKPETGEIPLLSLWLGAIEAQWFPLPVGIGSPGPGRFPYTFRLIPKGSFRCINHGQSTPHSVFDKSVELQWSIDGDWVRPSLEPGILWFWVKPPTLFLSTHINWTCPFA
jgi:hypothetical protein